MKKKRDQLYKAASVLLISALFLICGIHYFISETENDITLHNNQYLSEISHQNAVAVKKVVEMNYDKLSSIATLIGSGSDINTEQILKQLSAEVDRSTYKRMGFATPDGTAFTTDHQNLDISDRSYFKKAIQGENSISDKLTDKLDGQEINVYAAPFYQNSDIAGVIFATSSTEVFSDILNTPLFGEKGYIYIVTQEGNPVIYPGNKNGGAVFDNLFDEISADDNELKQMQKNMQSGISDTIEYTRDGKKSIAAYYKAGINDWYVIAAVPESVISQYTNQIIFRNMALSFGAMLMILLFIWFIFLQHKKTTRSLERIAYFDELIGFPNYNSFMEQSFNLLKQNPNKQYAFVMLDVDDFKLINERLGFDTGNQVLKNIALAISDVFTEPDEIFARISIDEFILMLNYKSPEYLKNARKKFEHKFQELMGPDFNYYIKFPTGRYITDLNETCMNDIFEKVNYAHRKAKQLNAKSGIHEFFYDEAEKKKALRKIDIESKMNSGIINKEFQVYLQPKYLLKNETIAGAEALVRWKSTEKTPMLPGEFIPVFEQNGFIVKLDLYMFEEVCIIIRNWIDGGRPVVPVSVNFSRLHLLNPEFISQLVSITDLYHIPRKYIEIELTESVIFENETIIIHVLQQAHDYGFLLSMDDFGSGYSSLGLLKNLPVDVIKIDRSFFINNTYKERANNVIELIMRMAEKLHVQTVAEGVEDADLINFLREVGCDIVQGYYYARPMPLDEFDKLLDASRHT